MGPDRLCCGSTCLAAPYTISVIPRLHLKKRSIKLILYQSEMQHVVLEERSALGAAPTPADLLGQDEEHQ